MGREQKEDLRDTAFRGTVTYTCNELEFWSHLPAFRVIEGLAAENRDLRIAVEQLQQEIAQLKGSHPFAAMALGETTADHTDTKEQQP